MSKTDSTLAVALASLTIKAPDTEDTRIRIGRPTTYSERVSNAICKRLMMQESLKSICADPRMPCVGTVAGWLSRNKDFRERYYDARRVAAELHVDDVFEEVRNTENDWEQTFDKNGDPNGWKPNHDAIQRSRLKVDTIKWYASKLIPRMYGDNINIEHEVTGDLAEMLKKASNNTTGLPEPAAAKVIEHDD